MSQQQAFGIGVVIPPTVATTFTTDDGNHATVSANNINISTADAATNFDNGIHSVSGTDTVTIQLTNRQTATVTTTDATPTTLLTFPMGAVPGVYCIEGNVVAFDATDVAGGAYTFVSAMRTTGAAGVEISSEFKDAFEEAAMTNSDIALSAVGNNCVVTCTGIAGKTIRWNAFLTFRFVS